VFPQAIVQACVIHLIGVHDCHPAVRVPQVLGPPREGSASDLHRPHRAGGVGGVRGAGRKVGQAVPSHPQAVAGRLAGVHTFLAYDVEIRRVLFSTNAIESLHARYRRAVSVRGHFPTEQAALKTLYLVTRGMDPKGTGQARWAVRWKPALNAFAVTFADRMSTAENL
jgi:putative transposase